MDVADASRTPRGVDGNECARSGGAAKQAEHRRASTNRIEGDGGEGDHRDLEAHGYERAAHIVGLMQGEAEEESRVDEPMEEQHEHHARQGGIGREEISERASAE